MRIEIFLANRLKDEVVQAIPFLPIINAKIILNPLSIGYISGQALMQEARGEINNQFLRTQGGQAASGIDSVEGLSWGGREGEALPFLEAQIASVIDSQGYLHCANSWYQPLVLLIHGP